MVHIVKERMRAKPYEGNITLVCSSLTDIVLPEASFDYVLCGDVLEHVDNDGKVLSHFYTVLKREGVLIASVPLGTREWDASDEMVGHKRLYDLDAFCSLIERAGFCITKRFLWGVSFYEDVSQICFSAMGEAGRKRGRN